MMLKVKPRAGITESSPTLPEPPAPMKRCWARLKPPTFASSHASQLDTRLRNCATYFCSISSNVALDSSDGRGRRPETIASPLACRLMCEIRLQQSSSSNTERKNKHQNHRHK